MSAEFPTETLQARRGDNEIVEVMKNKNLLYPARLPMTTEGEMESFPDRKKIKKFITNKLVL